MPKMWYDILEGVAYMNKYFILIIFSLITFVVLACDGTSENQTTQIVDSSAVVDYQMGYEQSIALLADGRVFTWGRNNHGQLAKNDMVYSTQPYDITDNFSLDSEDMITMVRMGHLNGLAVSNNQRVFIWGNNEYGQVLGSNEEHVLLPMEITDLIGLADEEQIDQVEIGAGHIFILTNTKRLLGWGYNGLGQLGVNIGEGDYIDQPRDISSIFNFIQGEHINKISLGYMFSSVLTNTGRVFTFGANEVYQLGNGYDIATYMPQNINTNLDLADGEEVIDIDMGYYHGSLITNQGNAYLWGLNIAGQLGIGNEENQFYPVKLNLSLSGEDKIKSIQLGGWHSMAISNQGMYYAWGIRNDGRLGIYVDENQNMPILINESFNLNEGEYVKYFSLGSWSSSAVTNQGRLWTWGYNKGRLGLGNRTSYTLPQLVTFD